jgi:O-antigen/teichoic acid export membrane protein
MLKSSVLYFFVDAVSKASSFIILPIITGALSVEDYGLYSLSLAITTFLVVGSAVGVDTVYGRMLYEPRIDASELFFTALQINFRYSIFFAVLAIPLLYLTYFDLLQSLLITTSFLTFSLLMYPRTYFVTQKQSKSFSIYSVTQFGSFLGLIGLLHFSNGITLTSVLAAVQISQLAAAIVAYTLFFRGTGVSWLPKQNLRILVRLRKYGKKAYHASLISYSLQYFDRYVVALLASKMQLGMYAFALALSGIVKTTGTSVMFSLQPKIYAELVNKETLKIEKTYLLLAMAAPVMYVLFSLLVKVLFQFFKPEYHNSFVLIMIMAFGAICEIFYQLVSIFYHFRYDTKSILKIESAAAVAQLFILPTAIYFGGMLWMAVAVLFIAMIKLVALDTHLLTDITASSLGSHTLYSRYLSLLACGVVCIAFIY